MLYLTCLTLILGSRGQSLQKLQDFEQNVLQSPSPLTRAQAVMHANVWLIKSLPNGLNFCIRFRTRVFNMVIQGVMAQKMIPFPHANLDKIGFSHIT